MKTAAKLAGEISPQQVAAFRLARHHLHDAKGNDPIEICRDVCGVQAQVMLAAHLNIAARTRGLSPERIEGALWRERTLVKTLCMRQTVHLLPAEEFHIYAAAVRRSRVAAVERIMARFRITAADREALLGSILEILRAGPVANLELTARVRPRVSGRVRAWMDRVWNANRLALVEGLICYGPNLGQQVTFVRVDQWLPRTRPPSESEAKRELLRKYLRAYGPATLRDFSHWSGIPVNEAREPWEASAGERVQVKVEGREASVLREDLRELRAREVMGQRVCLLAAFDPYVLAHAQKEHLVHPRSYKRVFRSLGWVAPVVLVGGSIAGTWTHRLRRGCAEISVQPFGRVSRAVRGGIEEQAEDVARFLGVKAAVLFSRG
ncbi:MAG TPA: winged helix DNA-binding domain-containing protein [Candidatus Solibacter sp.]|nr:winged helix DNA-binding domain-containing protein [Candidatus Solibacter sp.]